MDDQLRDRIEREAEEHALFNAVKHDSDADVGAIMGPLMGENPEFREHGDAVPGVVAPVVNRVNELSAAERRERLGELAPDRLEDLVPADSPEDGPSLPDLSGADAVEEVRMRCAPNPNGAWHIGHARMPAVIGTYAEHYDGWFCVRFDDTDPETKRPDLEAYDWILEDVEYLGFDPDAVYRASDRLELYYDHARELIDLGGAYTCSCPGDEFSALKNAGEPCPHRATDVDTVRDEFEDMIDGEYRSGERVLRVKTDIDHPNPALRDWVAFRMVDTPHPREEAAEYRCWPMLDFQSAIDDQVIGITHIIRGIDLQDSAKRQGFVYDYFGWTYPEVIHWGHVQIDAYDVTMSTSRVRELVEAGELDGWDDPRAPTLRSLRRRGIRGEAIVEAMVGLGTSTSNVDLSMSSIYANNRELIDDQANRYFLVRDGRELAVTGDPPESGSPPLHPDYEDRGRRTVPAGDAVRLETDDIPEREERVWLKGLGCFRYTRDALLYTGDDIDAVREEGVPVVHWVPADGTVTTTLRTMDEVWTGEAEPDVRAIPEDEVVQFERVGFARIDAHRDDETVAYLSHR